MSCTLCNSKIDDECHVFRMSLHSTDDIRHFDLIFTYVITEAGKRNVGIVVYWHLLATMEMRSHRKQEPC
jgi:hypothetical protein